MTNLRAHSTDTGAVIGPEADVSGLGGLFSRLMDEHGEAARLLTKVLTAKDTPTRQTFYRALRTALLAHEKTESSVLYTELREHISTEQSAMSHTEGARTLEGMIRALDADDIESNSWIISLNALVEFLQRHVREEERDFFPAALKQIGASRSEELLQLYQSVKPGIVNSIEADAQRSGLRTTALI